MIDFVPSPSPSATPSSLYFASSSSRLGRSRSLPSFSSYDRRSASSSPLMIMRSLTSVRSSAAGNTTQTPSGYHWGIFRVVSRLFLQEASSRLGGSHINQALTLCWKKFLSFLMIVYNVMRNTDSEPDLASIHPMLGSIEDYEISKLILVSVGIAMASSLYFSNSPVIEKIGMGIVADTLPVTFATLLIGLLLRKISVKYSFLFQLVGIGLGVFAFSASCFSFLSEVYYKWIPVVTGLLCLSLLVMPAAALISYDRNISEDENDLERGD